MNTGNPHSNSYTRQDIEQYLLGKLSPAEMHALEKAALQDPLLADSIEGYRNADASVSGQHLSDIRRQLLKPATDTPRINAVQNRNWWKVAAIVLVMAGAGAIGWLMLDKTVETGETARLGQPTDATASAIPKKDTTHEPSTKPAPASSAMSQPSEALRNAAVAEARRRQEAEEAAQKQLAALGKQMNTATVIASPPAAPPPVADEKPVTDSPLQTAFFQGRETATAGNPLRLTAPAARRGDLLLVEFKGVVKASNSQPVAGATVMIGNSKQGVSTNANGEFRFLAPDSAQKITITAPAFSVQDTIALASIPMDIRLNETREALAEVVITGLQTQAKRSAARSLPSDRNPGINPLGGWPAFMDTLRRHINSNTTPAQRAGGIRGTITASIRLNSNGRVENLAIQQTFNPALNAVLTETIRNWPAWQTTDPAEDKRTRTIIIEL